MTRIIFNCCILPTSKSLYTKSIGFPDSDLVSGDSHDKHAHRGWCRALSHYAYSGQTMPHKGNGAALLLRGEFCAAEPVRGTFPAGLLTPHRVSWTHICPDTKLNAKHSPRLTIWLTADNTAEALS